MANLITHSLSYSKQSLTEYFIKPLFIQNDIRSLITIRTNIKDNEKLDFFDKLSKITKAYAQGTSFSSSTGVTITQKTLTVEDMKAEVKQNGKAFLNYVKESLLSKGYKENDITGTLFEEIVAAIFMDALKADLQRQIFFGDTTKTTTSSDIASATADVHYNVYNGFWTRIITDIAATTIPVAQWVDLNSTTYLTTAGVKQVATTTLTGTSGTANITFNGTAYLATFTTDLTTSAANFVTSHAATIAARFNGAVVTSSGAGIIFTSNIAGVPISVSAAVNASGNLAGSVVATTANVSRSAMKADGAYTAFKALYATMPPVLKKNKEYAKFMCTASVVDNYRTTLESATAGSESAYMAVIDGVKKLAYRGIEIIERNEWDVIIDEDFGNAYPHRILLTIPQNLVFGTDGESDDMSAEIFYDKIGQENIFRVEYKAGTQYVHPDYICAAY